MGRGKLAGVRHGTTHPRLSPDDDGTRAAARRGGKLARVRRGRRQGARRQGAAAMKRPAALAHPVHLRARGRRRRPARPGSAAAVRTSGEQASPDDDRRPAGRGRLGLARSTSRGRPLHPDRRRRRRGGKRPVDGGPLCRASPIRLQQDGRTAFTADRAGHRSGRQTQWLPGHCRVSHRTGSIHVFQHARGGAVPRRRHQDRSRDGTGSLGIRPRDLQRPLSHLQARDQGSRERP